MTCYIQLTLNEHPFDHTVLVFLLTSTPLRGAVAAYGDATAGVSPTTAPESQWQSRLQVLDTCTDWPSHMLELCS